MKLDFKLIRNEILSPGNIFWKKNIGPGILISKKGDVVNLELIEKLLISENELILEESIDLAFHESLYDLYVKYSEELSIKDKIKYRKEIIECLIVEFIQGKKSQFELNHLAWRFFSQLSNSDAKKFIEIDKELFSRNFSIASSYTICAFLIGYYDTAFLSDLFTSTLKNSMEIDDRSHILTLKDKLDHLRSKESINKVDISFIEEAGLKSTMIYERYDGSGPRQLNSREMNDLEIVFVAINHHFGFDGEDSVNILSEIQDGKLDCVDSVLKMLQKVLYKEPMTVISITG